MILKERDKLTILSQLQVLARRLKQNDPLNETIQAEIRKRQRQVKGEKEVEFPLKFISEKEYFILHDLRIEDKAGFFQIDTLIISRRFLLILEIKNWYGTVIFNPNGQVLRIGDEGKEEGFPNPVYQSKLQQHRLNNWLQQNGFKEIPIEYLIIISFPSTIIKSTPPNTIPSEVIYNNELLYRIQDLENQYKLLKVSMKELRIIANHLISSHVQPENNILELFNLTKNTILKGVICPKCSYLSMIRRKYKWYCEQCNLYSVDAHLRALSEYKLLVGNTITNSEARDFLQVESPYVVKRLLKMGGYPFKGNTSNRVYYLNE